MAEVVLSPFLKVLIGKLAMQLDHEVELVSGVDKEIEKLSKMMRVIQASLNDAERRQVREDTVRIWLKELKDLAYDADDLIDEFATKLICSKTRDCGTACPKNKVCSFLSTLICFKQVMFRHEIGSRIKEMRERIDEIEKMRRFELTQGVMEKTTPTRGRGQTDSVITEAILYGRDEDRSKIIEMLLASESGERNLSIIPIVGMGGLGKTTLAQSAYNDQRVTKHFEIKMWVCVSYEFDLTRLVKEIIESKTTEGCDLPTNMDALQSRLQFELKARRFLLVLDDVWKEDRHNMCDDWERMKTYLGCGARGSKIIVTTRFHEIAIMMGTMNPYPLNGLLEDDCFLLFKRWAFGEGRGEPQPSLVEIGREIVKKCGGVPLAARALGSLLFSNTDESDWLSVRDSETWKERAGILPALRLSFNHLSSHLKGCFAYCSIFPRDYRIEKETLIQQWQGQGLIPSSEGCRQAEDIVCEYFNDLLWRSFFHDVKEDYWGNINACKMHNLVHDLAKSVAGNECLIVEANTLKSTYNQLRHVSLIFDNTGATFPHVFYEAKNLRTLLLFSQPYCTISKVVLSQMFTSLRRLRILDLGNTIVSELPNSIGNLIHLRYLDISATHIKRLPNSFSSLRCLQTLKLSLHLSELHQDMSKLKSLRHLDIRRCYALTSMPPNIGQLSHLQTLSRFIVGKESQCSISELHSLDLQRDLMIQKLENVNDSVEANEAKLREKQNLRALGLYWSQYESHDGAAKKIKNVEEVLNNLQPNRLLKRLWLISYRGLGFPRWLMNSSMTSLVDVLFYDCQRCVFLPPLGQLPNLRSLMLDKMDGVKELGCEFYGTSKDGGFPSLKVLVLKDMHNLEVWLQMEVNDFLPCLKELIIEGCPKLTSFPGLSSIRHLEIYGSNTEILRSVASVTSLSFLCIDGFSELESLPGGMLQASSLLQSLQLRSCPKLKSLSKELDNLYSLKELVIEDCNELECLPQRMQNFNFLESMWIIGCDSLFSFPDEEMRHLISLQKLVICHCTRLQSLPQGLQYLTLLKYLNIDGLPEIISLPQGLQGLKNIEILSIENCNRIHSLNEWLGNLTSLRTLQICKLPHLTCLPAGLLHLSALQNLHIYDCPLLEDRYDKNIGEEGHKVAHIPNVVIGSCGPLSEFLTPMPIGYSGTQNPFDYRHFFDM